MMRTEVKQCIIDAIYENGYLTRAEYDEIMSQISDDFIMLSENDDLIIERAGNDIRNIEIQFDEYYADIDILDVVDIEATVMVNQYNGYLMCEVRIAFDESDVFYEEVTLEGDFEECFA